MTTDANYAVTWYRSTIFAAFMVAMTALTLPGIFSALNGLGAGGGASADATNAANAVVFGVLAVFTPFVGVLCQKLTPKWTLFVGCTSTSGHPLISGRDAGLCAVRCWNVRC